MTRHARRLTPVYKEVRALLFPWLACIVLLVLPRAVDLRMTAATILIYFAGAAALGAMALGRDYTDGTLSLTLSLPVRRERLLIVKQAVLAA
ncbi:MAG TPA: ABC transporter permease subunit, partial [Vicinamibacterales bacterium]|nr:ABC transporter permease subunit [Vicinamibacterales bacterium]